MGIPVGRSVRVRVPATSANLGPGFDTLGLALNVHDYITATVTDTPGVRVTVRGVGEGVVPEDESNLVASTLLHVLQSAGYEVQGIDIVAENGIPHGRGMGSSGAAIVAGILAAKGLMTGVEEVSNEDVLRIANDLEGHPDNVAPAIFGGLTIAWVDEQGPHHQKLAVHRGVSMLLAVPARELSTEVARSLQPESVPHKDAVFNLARAALLIAALTQTPELLMPATEDKLHQSYRAEAMPETNALVNALRDAGHAAVVSGAGPSILVMSSDPEQRLRAVDLVEAAEGDWQAMLLAVDIAGATVEVLPTSERP